MLVLPIVAMLLIAGWLIYLARGSRPVRLRLKGFGIEISVDADRRVNGNRDIEHR